MVGGLSFKDKVLKYERHISVASIVAAFIIDSVTLVRIDLFLTNFLLVLYLVIVGIGIIIINLREEGRLRYISEGFYPWLLIAVQFSFGGLFARFLIYYSRSGSLIASWPFLAIFLVLLIGNEFAKKHYSRLTLQIGFLYLALFAFLIYFIPLSLGKIGDWIFVLSGVISLLIMHLYLKFLAKFFPTRIKQGRLAARFVVGIIFIALNLLYFTNVIPPLPLALHEGGVYHSIKKEGNSYEVTREEIGLLDYFRRYKVVEIQKGTPLFVYSAVFAPTNFETYAVHLWQHLNPSTEKWDDAGAIILPVVGGRDAGYRGYSMKSNLSEGLWRVNIKTLTDQVIGRVEFEVKFVTEKPTLITESL